MCEGNIALSNQFKLNQIEDHSQYPFRINSQIFDVTANQSNMTNKITV